ncbi:MAG: hypothetical protein BroJett030_25210 [Alphaproteobacteria bacterium]|nr:MAG: hypothetical protein BroJett030_25210 [Alphaproteobacteria bacterium]
MISAIEPDRAVPVEPAWCLATTVVARRRALFFAVALTALAAAVDAAHADFRLCNDTKSLIGVALGYRDNGQWVTEGWWQVPGETCASLIEGDLNSRYYYLYAEDADRGGQWRGDVFMCTSDRKFRIDGVEECFARGHQKTGFFEVDTGNKESWMVRLTESGQTGSSQ